MRTCEAIQKRCLLFFLASIAFLFYTKAQGFNKRYVDVRPAMQYGAVFFTDSNFYTIGITTAMSPPYIVKPMWSKLDFTGMLQEYHSLNDTDLNYYGTFFNTGALESDSTVKLYGYIADTVNLFPILWTIDYSGKVIRAKVCSDSISHLIRGDYMTGGGNGSYYLTASYQYVPGAIDAYVIKVNNQDSILWNKRYGALAPWDEAVTAVSLMNNGHVIVGSYKSDHNLPNMKSYSWIFEINDSGSLVRQWFDGDSTMEARSLKQTSDGGFIYASKRIITQDILDVTIRATVVKIDSSLGIEWKWEHPQTMGSGVGGTDIEELSNGDFLVCGKGNLVMPNHNLAGAFIMKLGSDGSEKWKQVYSALDTDGADSYLNDIDVLPDGSYVAVGYVNIPSSITPTQGQQAWMLKVDSNGCVIENCLVGIEEPRAKNQEQRVKIQPNPVSDYITIEMDAEMIGAGVKIYNIMGKIVKQLTAYDLQFAVDISELSKGMYIVTAEKEGKTARVKLKVE